MTNSNTKVATSFEEKIKEYKTDLFNFLFRLSNIDLRAFAYDVLTKDFPAKTAEELFKYNENLRIAHYAIRYLKEKDMYNETRPNKQMDSLMVAILFHNLFYDKKTDDWMQVFTARTKLAPIAEKYTTNENRNVIEYIWIINEAQAGNGIPILSCRPVPGQIAAIAFDILWFYENPISKVEQDISKDIKFFEEKMMPILNPEGFTYETLEKAEL